MLLHFKPELLTAAYSCTQSDSMIPTTKVPPDFLRKDTSYFDSCEGSN
ncbi:hypothetical protein F444_14773 [Phytophthora nicotianae P1976]|uniref:Uncharacterized protein n=1 Tax=Phytophthora nicotianae P1976 TaxID=1317066 RepID=A0A080ZP13_PHYNI|nr:hypothetical protein F444_14773 [Phytophthora nicotianae P1976]